MKNSRGFILLENMLALTLVLLLGTGALKLLLSAGVVYERGQSLITSVQLATQDVHGVAVASERYTIRRQRTEQQLSAGISVYKYTIGIYDEHRAVYVLSMVVYE